MLIVMKNGLREGKGIFYFNNDDKFEGLLNLNKLIKIYE